MKRSAELAPLSREHHTALSLARRIERALAEDSPEAAAALAKAAFATELAPHFAEEERWLLPSLSAAGERRLVERTLEEHRRLCKLVDLPGTALDTAALREFSALLREHVRFEERELFEAFERLKANPRSWLL